MALLPQAQTNAQRRQNLTQAELQAARQTVATLRDQNTALSNALHQLEFKLQKNESTQAATHQYQDSTEASRVSSRASFSELDALIT